MCPVKKPKGFPKFEGQGFGLQAGRAENPQGGLGGGAGAMAGGKRAGHQRPFLAVSSSWAARV